MITRTLKNGISLAIERADPADAKAVLAFLKKASGQTEYLISTPESFDMTVEAEADWLRAVAAQKDAATLCGKAGGVVAAIASLSVPQSPRIAHTGEVSVMVDKAFWRCGAGRAMMEALIDFAKKTGTLRLLHLSARADNAAALGLYRSLGFKEVGRLENYFCVNGRYYDEQMMTLKIECKEEPQ